MAELLCEGVVASYGSRRVLNGVDLAVAEGTITALLGASGSGKTTLLRVVMGFARLDEGRVVVGGTVVADADGPHVAPNKRGVGYVAQEGALYPHLTVGQNVGFGLPRAERRRSHRVSEVLELVGLDASYASRRVNELSGGEQRRVSLGRALAPNPRLVLLDEPFSGLDASLRSETRAAVLLALNAACTTALLVTHDQGEAMSTGKQVAVLRQGRLVQTAPPDVLYRTPTDLELATFLGEAVILEGHAHRGRVTCALGAFALSTPDVEGPVYAVVRPEQIGLGVVERVDNGAVQAIVTGCTFFGPDARVFLRLIPSGESLLANCPGHAAPDLGQTMALRVTGSVMAFPANGPASP